jgi:hypothetical protein
VEALDDLLASGDGVDDSRVYVREALAKRWPAVEDLVDQPPDTGLRVTCGSGRR